MNNKFSRQTTHSYIEQKAPQAIEFSFLDQEEIIKSSVVSIKNPIIYDTNGVPNFSGVNDPRMGTMDRDRICFTCKGSQIDCPGHFGHIELAKAVYHIGCIEYIRKLLKCICFSCGKLLYPKTKEEIEQIKRIRQPKQRFLSILKHAENYVFRYCETKTDNENIGCGMKQPKFIKKNLQIFVEYFNDNLQYMQNLGYNSVEQKAEVWPEEVLRVFSKLTIQEQELLGIKKPQNMIIKRLLVCPPNVRPSVNMGGPLKSEDDLTYSYQKILTTNVELQKLIERGANLTAINQLRKTLQFYVAVTFDNETPGIGTHKHKSGKPLKAIRARLRGKEGRVRGNLMGKRVDFSARSVITPDPNLELDQLGVPMAIAQNVTIPEVVTPQNIDELRMLVENGPNRYPGAKYIIRHDERQIDIGIINERCDVHLEYGYKVERHLRNGDYVLFNRQPSLHKMSIMGHRAKILPFSTFRLNLSVTTPYNADFDGDEMNMFVPQGFESMAEVKEIMAVPNQIISPQSNKPVMGIVQDSLLGIMLFSKRDTFITKEVAMNLMMWLGTINANKVLPTPAVLKPKLLWTGKQILSLVIPNVNLCKFFEPSPRNQIRNWCPAQENIVLIQAGELLTGYLNKATAGSSSSGLIHIIWKECGPDGAKEFLTNAQCVVNQQLIYHGFTVGVQDTIASARTMQGINQKLTYFNGKVQKLINKAERGKLTSLPGKNMMESFEYLVNNKLNQARDEAGQLAFKDLDPWNKIQNMVGAGSKGTNINISQIMGCVGQQNIEGKRIHFGFKQRTLPHFQKHDYGPASKGFVKNNYISGLDPPEFFFHAMGGREGLIDTAVKTSETGYIQRRLIKALEDVMVKYDATVRNSSSQVIQFLYGEDGMSGEHIEDLKIDLLKMSNAELDQKYQFIPERCTTAEVKEKLRTCMTDDTINILMDNPNLQMELQREKLQILQDREELRTRILKNGDDQIHIPINIQRLLFNCHQQFKINKSRPTKLDPMYVVKQVQQLTEELTVFPGRANNPKVDVQFQEANENSTKLMKIYLRSELNSKTLVQKERLSTQAFDYLLGEIKSRFETALVHPGEMVGSIAAHSLGEPATQMTLNTFHFAGVSSKNVTLGVPRLKEVINVSKNIRTPMNSIYLQQQCKKSEKAVMEVQGIIEHTNLSHLIMNSGIYYDPDPTSTIISEDQALVALYNEVPDLNQLQNSGTISPWVLRLRLDPNKLQSKDIGMDFIDKKIQDTFGDQVSVMASDTNASINVLRLRFRDITDEDDYAQSSDQQNGNQETAVMFLKSIEEQLIHDFTLKGIPEISKVYAKKYQEIEYDTKTGVFKQTNDNFMLETDGVALQKILSVPQVDYKKTISNDILEILKVLGIEAVRMSLINELRAVLNFYGIYVNYRHLSTLCDVMCQRGRLTSITRHGINRMDSGPLRKASFEETVEILLEAALYNETDHLKGVTEAIMLGKLAPLGTGSFDVLLNEQFLQQFAQVTADEEVVLDIATPFTDEDVMFPNMYNKHHTPYAETTPLQKGGMTSVYQQTPGGQSAYDGQFSPGQNYQSPSYMSPNPYMQSPMSPGYRMQSPIYGQTSGGYGSDRYTSPIYQAYSSPIYQQVSDGVISPQNFSPTGGHSNITQSPNYSPHLNSNLNSPYNPTTGALNLVKVNNSPSYLSVRQGSVAGNSNLSSPALTNQASPHYSPSGRDIGSGSIRSNNSPAYSPTANVQGGYSNASPHYSPTNNINYSTSGLYQNAAKSNYSPSYAPTSPGVNAYGTSPKYTLNKSPRYQIRQTSELDYENAGKSGDGGDQPQILSQSNKQTSATILYIPHSPIYGGSSAHGSNRGGSSSYQQQQYQRNSSVHGGNSEYQPMYDPEGSNRNYQEEQQEDNKNTYHQQQR